MALSAYPRRCYWPRHRSKAKEDLSWPKPTYSYLVPTLKERPAESRVVSSSVCLDTETKLHLVPTPEERPARRSVISSQVCLNTKATSPYLLHLVPMPEERPAGKQCRFVLSVSKHQGDQCTWCPHPRRGLLKVVSFRPQCV